MKNQASFFLCFWLITGLTACNLPVPAGSISSGQDVVQQYETVSALLTSTAQVSPASTLDAATLTPSAASSAETPGAALTSVTRVTPLPSAQAVFTLDAPAASQTSLPRCDLAQPGRPIDITVPDETHFSPGEYFSKTWRLVNSGSCAWTRDYAVIWFSGDDLGFNHSQSFTDAVPVGKSVDVTVDMVAPQQPGTYQSNWKLRNEKGELFGIGPNGDAPFWVRIIVIPVNTPTATPPLPTPTQTPVILASGPLALSLGDGIDLDTGQLNQAEKNDLAFQKSTENDLQLAPLGDARLVAFGSSAPSLDDCLLASLSDAPAKLDQYPAGSYFCYRTGNSLPGRLLLSTADLQKGQLSLEFITWAVP